MLYSSHFFGVSVTNKQMHELKEKQETKCVFYYSNAVQSIRTLTKQSSDRGKKGIEQLLWVLIGVWWRCL